MTNAMKRFLSLRVLLACLATLILGVRTACGFALLGPFDTYQVGSLSYQLPGDIGGPMNLGEEYRWNTPTLYYTFDQSFVDYFGGQGMAEVDKAFAILNSLTNVDAYSHELSEFPLEASRVNFLAQALQLVDIKSTVLHLMIEEMGLAEPDRWTWTLRHRALPPGASCPAYVYTVIKRNFDPVTWEPSSYVNGTLYSYAIIEACPVLDVADAFEIPVDPLSNPLSAVASLGSVESFIEGQADLGLQRFGFFYTGLTRDDVGGLRYLLTTNNANFESVAPNSDELVTNLQPQLLFGSNLTLFAAQALTNNAAALQALYPGLVVTSSSNFFGIQPVTNFTAFVTNPPWAPAGVFTFVIRTNITYVPQTFFSHTFANVVTLQSVNGQLVAVPFTTLNSFVAPHIVLLQTATVIVTNPPWAPPTSVLITSNLTTRPILTNTAVGEFFILPTNACDLAIVSPFLTNIVGQTNSLINFTNAGPIVTNVNGGSNNFVGSQVLSFQQFTVDIFTNHIFVVLPISCVPGTVDLRQGIQNMKFVRRDFDSLIGRAYTPLTNFYEITAITNSQPVTQRFRRIVTAPDIVFSAADLGSPPTSWPINNVYTLREDFVPPHLDEANAIPGLPGPGTIQPPMNITLNKSGAFFINAGPAFIDEATGVLEFLWGSFDGTTNLPVVYPSGASLTNLQNQILILIDLSPATASVGANYNGQVTVTGGTPPYTVALTPYSPPLPAGLSLSSSGALTGTPLHAGTFVFVVRVTDANGIAIDKPLSLEISP
jgi:hypothetical protein